MKFTIAGHSQADGGITIHGKKLPKNYKNNRVN